MADSLGTAVLTITADDRTAVGLQSAKRNIDKELGGIKGLNFGGITAGLASAALAATAVTAGVVAIGAAAVQSAGGIQRLNAAFTGLTGSAEAAQQLRQQLFDLSKTTPFKNEEILQAAQRFLAVGVNVENLNGSINRIGSLAAQAGQPLERLALIYAQVYAKGRLQGEENLQLLEAGVDLSQELAQVTGLTGTALQDAMSKGQVSIDAFNQALILATGDMAALQQAGKAVDVQFNNIGDNFGQVFGGFAQAISPALSAAFKVINDIFESAFPDLQSISEFFAPLTESAKEFADVLGSSPGIIEIIATGLKSIGEVIIVNIADGIQFISDLLANVDQKAFIQGFIDAEVVVRRLLLASSALGAQLVKNAELSFRAVTNPLQFGKDIAAAGGFGEFIEKEYQLVERKWNDWADSEPLKFPDLTGKAAKQADQIAGDLSQKGNKALEQLVKSTEAKQKAEESILAPSIERLNALKATVGLQGVALEFAQQQLAVDKARTEQAKAIAAYDQALVGAGFDLDNEAVISAAAKLEAASIDIKSALLEGAQRSADIINRSIEQVKSATNNFNSTIRGSFDFFTRGFQEEQIRRARASIQPLIDRGVFRQGIDISTPERLFQLANVAESFNNAEKELVAAQKENTIALNKLAEVDWRVNVQVNADGTYQAYGDVVNNAVGVAL